MLLQACLNGARSAGEHRALPITAAAIARDAVAVMRSGAAGIHVHPRNAAGLESLEPGIVTAVVGAVRKACPGLPVGVTTGAWIEPDLDRRLTQLAAWTELPDYASVNLSEAGALQVVELLNERGIGVEAGVGTEDDAHLLVDEGLDAACLRVLVEVEAEADPMSALTLAGRIDTILDDGLVQAPRLHHGGGIATWRVIETAMDLGHDVRVGLEDCLLDEDGRPASDNAELVAAAAAMAAVAGRVLDRVDPS